MKNVIHIVDRLSLGGVTSFIKNLAIHQLDRYNVSILTLESEINDNKEAVQIIKNHNIPIYRCNNNKFNPISVFGIYRQVKRNEIIHVHLFPSLYWVSLVSFFFDEKKFIFTEHSLFNNRRKKYLKQLETFIYKRYNSIVGVSESVSKDLINWVGLPKKISFINNGVNLKTAEIKTNYSINKKFKNKKLVIIAARIGYPKNHKTLIKAFKILDSTYQLLIVGDGPNLAEMKELTNHLNISEKVSFLGRRNDVLSLMKTCDLSVLSTFSEGFGLGIIESLSVQTPCIGSDIEVIRNIIKNDDLLFQVEDEKELATKIQTTIENKEFYNRIIIEGNILVKEYSIEEMVKKYNHIYVQ